MPTSCTDLDHPLYEKLSKLGSDKGIKFFSGNERKMHYVSLGEMLDLVSYGCMNACAWETDSKGLVNLTKQWMAIQKKEFPERILNWNDFKYSFTKELPHIDFDCCPENESHREIIFDKAGRKRCGHISYSFMKPNFIEEEDYFDSSSMMLRKRFWERKPYDPSYQDDFGEISYPEPDYQIYLREKELFPIEKPEEIINPCYAIISDVGITMSLETVFNRLSVYSKDQKIAFPFSGFDLANYVSRWHEQKEKIFFNKNNLKDVYKKWPNFEIITSED